MKWMSTALSLGAVVGLLALAGCKHDKYADDYPPGGYGPSPISIAKQACEITSLAEERDVVMRSIDGDVSEGGTESKEHRYTIVKEKLLEYRAEVDASYRFVTASCNAYNLCMENNGYDEKACSETRRGWVDSHDKFNELAISINKNKPWRKHHRRGHDGGYGDKDCNRSNCGSFGGYSQECCYDGD